MADDLSDLIEFLSDARPDVRSQAAEIVQGLSGSEDGARQLAERADRVVPPLLRLLGKPEAESRPAAVALVNLTQAEGLSALALDKGAVERVMDRVRDAQLRPVRGLLIALLANLTQGERGAALLLQQGRGDLEGFHLATLLEALSADPGGCPHVATVSANVSAVSPLGRALLSTQKSGFPVCLAAAASWDDAVARVGALRALRNCAADPARVAHGAILAAPGALDAVLDAAAAPAAAPPRSDEERCAAAEALAALARSESGREALWAAGAPERLRIAYEAEACQGVCTAMEETVALLMARGREEQHGEDDVAPPPPRCSIGPGGMLTLGV